MTREEFVELLKSYKENKARLLIKLKELKNARIQLKNIDRYNTSVTSAFGINQDIHSKNQISDKVAKKVEQNDNDVRMLEDKIKKIEEEVRELRKKVDTVEDRLEALKYKEKTNTNSLLCGRGRTAEDIGNKLYFQLFSQTRSDRHIQRIIDKATKKMLNL